MLRYSKYHPGDIVGELTLEYKFSVRSASGRQRSKWHCKCSCGTECDILETNLVNTKSCGHIREEFYQNRDFEDLTGQIFGWLTVKERAESRRSRCGRKITRWLCVCDCGKDVVADARELKKGTVTSCGCHKFDKIKARTDMTGQIINSIYVLEKLESAKYVSTKTSRFAKYLCYCLECGSFFEAFGSALRRGQITCGCINSKGEYKIGNILSHYGIAFQRGYSFDDLLSPNNFPVFFDFALRDDENNIVLIEYQGEQHYIPQKNHFGDYQREVTDPLKKEYCKENSIKLYEISYLQDIKQTLDNILCEIYANFVPSKQEIV